MSAGHAEADASENASDDASEEARAQARAQATARVVVRLAVEAHASIAVAESLTAGLLCGTLASVPGVSQVLRGGVTTYATDLKARLLGVDAGLLERGGAVQAEVAAQMAVGVSELLAADYTLATTGVAGPDSQDGASPGTVFVAVRSPQGQRVVGRTGREALTGSRARVRWDTVTVALELLADELRKKPRTTHG